MGFGRLLIAPQQPRLFASEASAPVRGTSAIPGSEDAPEERSSSSQDFLSKYLVDTLPLLLFLT